MPQATMNKDIHALMIDLDDKDIKVRQRARQTLTAIGPPAVPQLINALYDPRDQIRWQSALILGHIGDGAAAPALVKILEDEALEVRWRAAESLAELECQALVPLLRALIHHPESPWLREGAHHALRILIIKSDLGELIKPILKAFDAIEPTITIPIAAATALQKLNQRDAQNVKY
ncbi:MAG: HEAT repeat domain-containing protein [Anaerolineae bacterium]|nr:HEAT repeat domain-containing protein [Anaerolineae bacterium]